MTNRGKNGHYRKQQMKVLFNLTMGHKSLSIVIYTYIYKYMPRKNWLWHTAQFGYALNLFTMETLCLIDYLINGDSNGGIIREKLRDNQGSLNAVCWNPMTIHFIILFFPRTFNYFILKSLEFMVGGSIFKTFASTLCKR